MRITVSHDKGRREAMRIVDDTADQLFRIGGSGTVKVSGFARQWQGDTMSFSLSAGVGPFRTPIKGWISVTDRDIVIDADLPPLLTRFVSERTIQSALESRVRGLLGS